LDVLNEKIESLRRCVARVALKTALSEQEFLDDLDAQDVVVLNLERAVQLCVDMATYVLARTQARAPDSMANAFERLHQVGFLSESCLARMKAATGFRNLAVHQYADLNFSIVFSIASNHLHDFAVFAKELTDAYAKTLPP